MALLKNLLLLPNGSQPILLILFLTLFSSQVNGYSRGRWWRLRPTESLEQSSSSSSSSSTSTPEPTTTTQSQPDNPLFPRPRYQYPSAVRQPPSSSEPPTAPELPEYPSDSGPPLRGRPPSRYIPTTLSPQEQPTWSARGFRRHPGRRGGGGGWSSPQNYQPTAPTTPAPAPLPQPSLNDTLNPYRHNVTLNPNYQLVWVYDWSRNLTIFNVTVNTTGWVGFGLARRVTGKMTGTDLIMGGVYPNGTSYFTDRHALGNQLPMVDPSQDWNLHDSWERDGLTFLSFSRALDTCDPEHDIPITDDSLRILWAFGESDELRSHYKNRGVSDAYLLMPDLTPEVILTNDTNVGHDPSSSLQVFNMTVSLPMAARDTTYWCKWFKAPTTTKHHIIGYNAVFPTDTDRRHTHHLSVNRCYAPPGIDPDELFGEAAKQDGSECYFDDEVNPLPYQYCRDPIILWGIGGSSFFLPEHVGLPLSEEGSEYYLLQVHYDNPENVTGLNITVTVRSFYTSELREYDGSILNLGQQVPAAMSIVIPAMVTNHASIGVCPGSCTEQGLRGQEVNIVAGMLHTHTTGAAARIMQLRGDKELPWVISDDNWNYNFQQFRVFHQERKLKPGDTLIQRCEYDTTQRNGSSAVGGYGAREAMCTSNLYYYPRQKGFALCRSLSRDEGYWNLLKIRNATWNTERRQVIITDPPEYAGLTMLEHANQNLEWTEGFRRELQMQKLFAPQVAQCSNTTWAPEISMALLDHYATEGSYPPVEGSPNGEHPAQNPRNIPRYRRPPQCNARDSMMRMSRVGGLGS